MEGEFGSEGLSSDYLEPVTSESQINYDYVYALFNFMATLEGQISVLRGEELELVDDSNSYWWAVKCISTGEIGYIPAENIETPEERLARLNRHRNAENTEARDNDRKGPLRKPKLSVKIQFAESHIEIYPDGDLESAPLSASTSTDDIESDASEAGAGKTPTKRGSFFTNFFKRISKNVMDSPDMEQPPNTPVLPAKRLSMRSVPLKQSMDTPNLEEKLIPLGDGTSAINVLRVYPGNINISTMFKSVSFGPNTTIESLLKHVLKKFRIQNQEISNYYITITDLTGEYGNAGTNLLN
jgi:hypothetical protein